MQLEVGQAYRDGNGNTVAIVAQHPWDAECFIGCLPNGTFRQYTPAGVPQFPYAYGRLKKLLGSVFDKRERKRHA
jgi:hypothetical protein